MKPERRRQIEDLIESMERGVTPSREVALEALLDLAHHKPEAAEGRILFLDLETTGLDPDRDQILEVGGILVDPDLQELGRLHYLIDPPRTTHMLETIGMHRSSGLIKAMYEEGTGPIYTAEESILEYLAGEMRITTRSLEIAGFSIQFDRSFLRVHMPRLHGWLSHRMIDVSTLRALQRRWVGQPRKQNQAHRAIADCEEAIAELRTYRHLFNVTTNEVSP